MQRLRGEWSEGVGAEAEVRVEWESFPENYSAGSI